MEFDMYEVLTSKGKKMKIEIGKFYRSRIGEKFHAYAKHPDPDTSYPIVCILFNQDNLFSTIRYTEEGKFWADDILGDPNDLVEEWVEPKFEITEPGRYKTRKGEEVYVVHVLPAAYTLPIKVFFLTGGPQACWNKDGSYHGIESKNDIVEKI